MSVHFHFNDSALKTYIMHGRFREGPSREPKWVYPRVSSFNSSYFIDSGFQYAFIHFNYLLLIYSALDNQGALSVDTMLYFIYITSFRAELLKILNR